MVAIHGIIFNSIPTINTSYGSSLLTSSSSLKSIGFSKNTQLNSLPIASVHQMTIKHVVRIADRRLVVKDRTILNNVPENVIVTLSSTSTPAEGVFLGVALNNESSRHVVSLGKLIDSRFMASFRFKLWWMAQKMGENGRDIPLETQFLLVETKDEPVESENQTVYYTVFLPLIEGPFRSCLQGNDEDELELCIESGDVFTTSSSFAHSMYISSGTDPFATITDAIAAVKSHLGTFRQRHEKKLPEIVDYFGWCTWDAFYQDVTQEGVEAGLDSLTAGGVPPKFVIIDDGWQSVGPDQLSVEDKPAMRLTGIKENEKFQKEEAGIKNIVNIAKEKYGLKYVYVWHAITGYWGGVRPGVKEMDHYESEMKYPIVSNGVMKNEPGWKTDAMAVQGLGLVNPKQAEKFYDELHSYLAESGIDGVKVDVQCILETMGSGFGGRVEITKQFHQALDASVAKNFPDNGCIACMSHNTDALYCSNQTAVVRASDDFYPRDPVSHTIHIASVAYNSVFLGEFMLPDWDMFHSFHPAAEYHASARAISGGPVYVSDAPGKHNFSLLRKLVLPDGSILRARLPGRPTVDCLMTDPARDDVSLLKIWNMNNYTGVLGVYNCQGAAWNTTEKQNTFHQTKADTTLTCFIKGSDVHLIAESSVDDPNWNGNCAFYCHRSGDITVLPEDANISLSLKILEHEIFTVTPIKVLSSGVSFAPFGLVEMYNAGGAIESLEYETGSVGVVRIEVKGRGRFGGYSSAKPKLCKVNYVEVEFEYESGSGLVSVGLDHMPEFHVGSDRMPEEGLVHFVEFEF
ncbi:probable galactinol--sucrose galactosyltransferase 6 [Impatiens glandulifera]|uniref:probable galactinol--sucrose galactosyltransferase 6 n=1 Tax=Impatiens glandulifera TaxID=253017 RepID=UPI001FB0B959|nr:probable galactinol--sucrose galactosyltransferase 6 [Impatiens glandulifera]